MIFNDPGCTLTWKSNKRFETPTRFNLLSAPESNSSLDLILDMRSNNIQILSSALISLVVSIAPSCYVSKFFKNMFPPNSASPSDLTPLFGQRSVKKASEAQGENSGWDRAKDSVLTWSWILHISSEHDIPYWLLQNAFPFHLLFSSNMNWKEMLK